MLFKRKFNLKLRKNKCKVQKLNNRSLPKKKLFGLRDIKKLFLFLDLG